MTWLTIQTIAWCLVGFCVGALAAWLVAVMLFPHERDLASASNTASTAPSTTTDEDGADE